MRQRQQKGIPIGLLAALIDNAALTNAPAPMRPTVDPMFGFKKILNTSREQSRRLKRKS